MSPERSWLALALALAALTACDDWRTDLWYQQARQARETPRPEPEGSVALRARPHLDDREDAQAMKAPFAADRASVERGRALFADRCAACHGAAGRGGGPVARSFPPAPDLAYAAVRARSDGFIYATISLGGRAMPRLSEGLDERDRWDLVHFVRRIQAEAPPAAPALAQEAR